MSRFTFSPDRTSFVDNKYRLSWMTEVKINVNDESSLSEIASISDQGWRLPSYCEMLTLIDESKTSVGIFDELVDSTKNGNYLVKAPITLGLEVASFDVYSVYKIDWSNQQYFYRVCRDW